METEKKKLSFLENISAKFTKTFAEKFPESRRKHSLYFRRSRWRACCSCSNETRTSVQTLRNFFDHR